MSLRISQLKGVVNAVLLNAPAFETLSGVASCSGRVKRGECCFCASQEEICEAVQNGAFGVIFEAQSVANSKAGGLQKAVKAAVLQSVDAAQLANFETKLDETALLCVEDLAAAKDKWMRFLLSQSRAELFAVSEVVSEIFSLFVLPKNFAVFSGEFESDFAKFEFEPSVVILPQKYAQKCDLNVAQILPLQGCVSEEGSLFWTSVAVGDSYFSQLPFVRFYGEELGGVIDFLQSRQLAVKARDLRAFSHFEALFLGSGGEVCEYGQSARVVICEADAQEFESQKKWLQKRFLQGVFYLDGTQELSKVLNERFRYILIHAKTSEVLQFLARQKSEATLF